MPGIFVDMPHGGQRLLQRRTDGLGVLQLRVHRRNDPVHMPGGLLGEFMNTLQGRLQPIGLLDGRMQQLLALRDGFFYRLEFLHQVVDQGANLARLERGVFGECFDFISQHREALPFVPGPRRFDARIEGQ